MRMGLREDSILSDKNQPSLVPVAESSRIDVMDILRGFALVGIVFMNIEFFNRSGTDLRTFDASLTGLDHAIGWLIRAFIEGKFYKIFSLLFGMGFAVMLLRAREAGRPFGAWFLRRMLVLFAIGTAHNYLLWDGDILHDYAFAGIVFLGWIYLFQLPWLKRFNTPTAFLKIGLVWLFLPFLVLAVNGVKLGTQTTVDDMRDTWQYELEIAAAIEERLAGPVKAETDSVSGATSSQEYTNNQELTEAEQKEQDIEYWVTEERRWLQLAETETGIMSGDSYIDAVRYRAANFKKDARKTVFFTAVLLMPIFLIGYWFVASGVLRNHREHRTVYASMTIIGLGFGTLASVAGLLMIQHPIDRISDMLSIIAFWLFNLGQALLATGYFGAIVLLVSRPIAHRVLGTLAPFGRMALTNYIMQTVILIGIFHGYAGGMYGKVSRSEQMLVVIAIVVIQALFSAWWLKRFRFGPLEWLWRSATYMSWQPLRIKAA